MVRRPFCRASPPGVKGFEAERAPGLYLPLLPPGVTDLLLPNRLGHSRSSQGSGRFLRCSFVAGCPAWTYMIAGENPANVTPPTAGIRSAHPRASSNWPSVASRKTTIEPCSFAEVGIGAA